MNLVVLDTKRLRLVLRTLDETRSMIAALPREERALIDYAFGLDDVLMVRAHTCPEPNASTRVLTKCGFQKVGEFVDPEDGFVWRWDLERQTHFR